MSSLLDIYLHGIQSIIAELRTQLDSGNIQAEAAAKIREYLDRMEHIAEQYKEP